MPAYLTPQQVHAWRPDQFPPAPGDHKARLAGRVADAGLWQSDQIAGRRWAMGCVALEITQRCNLDCSLCYLSEKSEAVHDLPLVEVLRRVQMIRDHFGPNTDVQVTGGDPTLRDHAELTTIVRAIADAGMRPSLFTNGIRATRQLLERLTAAGLVDVAFHVDMTQERNGYETEADLNAVRLAYIDRARGLPLSVFFNTTVFDGNFEQIPDLIRFFRRHTDVVRLASFQLQADTGRGVLRSRGFAITPRTVAAQISAGAGTDVRFDVPRIGHPDCNGYGLCLAANGNLHNVFDDRTYFTKVFGRIDDLTFDRTVTGWRAAAPLAGAFLRNPDLWLSSVRYIARKAWQMRHDLWRGRGRVGKLSFFIHNFMDAEALEHDRCKACIFMVATANGPISMCVHNAKRDQYILQPVRLATPDGDRQWHPASGEALPTVQAPPPVLEIPAKRLKGRAKPAKPAKPLAENAAS